MIDLRYSYYVTELLMNQDQTAEMLFRRFDALKQLRAITAKYEEEGFLPELIETVFCKKADHILKAKTKAQIKEILEPSTPGHSCGSFYPGSPCHVEEEELILWSRTSLRGPLVPEGYKRYRELFGKYVAYKAKEEAV